MLIERTFVLGGIVCVAAAVGLTLAVVVWAPDDWGSLISSAFLFGFGALFLYVGRGARRSRLALLASPQTVEEARANDPPSR